MTIRLYIGISTFLISSTQPITSPYSEPLALWPLGNDTLANEVKIGGTPESQNLQIGISFYSGLPYPNFSYVPVFLSGGNPIDLEIPLIQMPSNSEFHLFFFIWTKSENANLIHYKTTSVTPSGITEFQIWLNNLNINGKVKFNDGSEETPFIVTGSDVFHFKVWYRLGIGVDKSNANMIFKIFMNDEEALRLTSAHATLDLDLPGILRIGSSFDDVTSNVAGMVTCVLLYGNSNPGSVLDMQNECNSWNESNSYTTTAQLSTHNSDTVTTDVPETTSPDVTSPSIQYTTGATNEQSSHAGTSSTCNPVTTSENYEPTGNFASGYFIVLELDASPQLIPLSSMILTFSLSACASHCLRDHAECITFTMTKSSGSHVCTLYGDVSNVPRQTVIGTNLYELLPYHNSTIC